MLQGYETLMGMYTYRICMYIHTDKWNPLTSKTNFSRFLTKGRFIIFITAFAVIWYYLGFFLGFVCALTKSC